MIHNNKIDRNGINCQQSFTNAELPNVHKPTRVDLREPRGHGPKTHGGGGCGSDKIRGWSEVKKKEKKTGADRREDRGRDGYMVAARQEGRA